MRNLMISKRLVLVLLVALFVPVAPSMAGNTEPSPAPTVSPSRLGANTACTENVTLASILGEKGAQTSAGLPATPFAQRQDKSALDPPDSCFFFCYTQCGPYCGGYPYTQCHCDVGTGCHAICWCFDCG